MLVIVPKLTARRARNGVPFQTPVLEVEFLARNFGRRILMSCLAQCHPGAIAELSVFIPTNSARHGDRSLCKGGTNFGTEHLRSAFSDGSNRLVSERLYAPIAQLELNLPDFGR